MFNKELAEELHKTIVRKLKKKQKVYSSFIDNIWGDVLADIQFIRKFNKGVCFLLYIIDIFGKYGCVIPLKDKKCITITYAFQKVLDEYNHKPNKRQHVLIYQVLLKRLI